MTPEEFKKEMKKIDKMLDPESKHMEADDLMAKVLEEKGYGAGVDIYTTMDK